MTNDDSSMAAELLAVSTTAYAAYSSNRLLEKVPEAKLKLGDNAFRHWKEHFTERIRELSAALSENQPVLFTSRVIWSREAFIARALPETLLRDSLQCLDEVLQEELPAFCAQSPSEFIASALNSLEQSVTESPSEADARRHSQAGTAILKNGIGG